jgi:predicted MFS family arabinose efflux permease
MNNTLTEEKPNWNAVFSLTVGVSGLIIAEFLPAGVLTPLAYDLHVTEGMAGQAISATSILAVFTSLFISSITAHLNRRTVLLALSFLLACSSIIVAFASNFPILLSGRMLLGISLGGFWSMATAITIRLVPDASVPKALSIIFGGSSFSAVLAAPLGSFLGEIIGWRNVFLLAAVVGLAAFTWQFFALPSLPPASKPRLRTIIDVLRVPQFFPAFMAIMFIFCGRFASFTYLRPFLEKTTHLSPHGVSAALLTFGLSYFFGNWFAPGMIKRNIRLALWLPPLMLSLVGVSLAFLGSSPVLTFAMLFLWGALFGPVAPSWSTWVARKVPEYAETAGGLYVASIQFAAAVGAIGGGLIFDHTGSVGVFGLSSLSWVISAFIVIFGVSSPLKIKVVRNGGQTVG